MVEQYPCSHSPLKVQVMGRSDSSILAFTPGKTEDVRVKELLCVPVLCPSPNFWSEYCSLRKLEVLQSAPAWTQPKIPEHPGILLFCFCYLFVFGPKSGTIEGKHIAAFVLPALQVTLSNDTFRCIT